MLGRNLADVRAKWALGGDAGEVVQGVNLRPDRLEIVTTSEGTDRICARLAEFVAAAPAPAEKRLARDAEVDGRTYPVRLRSRYAELWVDEVRVEVYGDAQIRVGEWEWGDPLDYEPRLVNLMGTRVPAMPLRLKSDLDLGLGWLDRVQLISDAMMRAHHR